MSGKMTPKEYNNPLSTTVRSGGFHDISHAPHHLPLGCEAPDFTLPDLNRNKVNLSEFRGKSFVVLEFGSIT
jgi:peroxiredoxin